MKIVFILSAILAVSLAHREYMARIPNGNKVPNPCRSGEIWEAVGHNQADSGHGGENQFGKDFKHDGLKHWNTKLCQMDSDGDGMTNGAELGDPGCVWTPDSAPSQPAKGHPGICEPLTDTKCSLSSPC